MVVGWKGGSCTKPEDAPVATMVFAIVAIVNVILGNREWRTIEVYIVMSARVWLLLWLALLTN